VVNSELCLWTMDGVVGGRHENSNCSAVSEPLPLSPGVL
jgi:hypothetical protein